MRLLLLTSEFLPLAGGIGTYAREMAMAAAELGATVTVAAPDYGWEDLSLTDRNMPFQVKRFRGDRHRARDLPGKMKLVRALLAQEAFDVAHAVDWPFFLPLRFARRFHHGRSLLTLHGTEINEIADSYKRRLVNWCGLFDGWAETVTNSQFTRRLLLDRIRVNSPQRVRAELLGVSTFWHEPAQASEVTRNELGIASDAIVLVTVGRLTPRKGQLTMIEAIRSLPADQQRRVYYLIVGPTYDEGFTEKLAEASRGALADIRIMGEQTDRAIRNIYAASDLFCLVGGPDTSGRVEGFGLVILEAAAQMLPTLGSATGGVPEVIRDGVSGLLVAPEDSAATAAAISKLIDDLPLRQKLRQGALERARELSWRRCAEATYFAGQMG